MSNVSTIYDRVLVVLASIYSAKTRLTNSYDLEDNASHLLENGYGLKIGSSVPNDAEFHNKSFSQSMTIVLTSEVFRLESDATAVDTIIKNLLEDVNTGQKTFYNINQIEIEASVRDIDLGSVSDIQYFKGDTNFISVEYEIIFQIEENL